MLSRGTMIAALSAILAAASGCAAGGVAAEKTGPHDTSPDGSGKGGFCLGCGPANEGDASSNPADAGSPSEASSSPDTAGSPPDTGSPPPDSGSSSDTGASPACPGGPTEIDLHSVTLYSNPSGLADWPVTTSLTEVDFTSAGVAVQFSKMDGSGRWPDVIPPGWGGPLQYTIGMVECIAGAWYASAVIEVWYGLPAAGGNVALDNQVAVNWYYDAVRWGMLAGRQPATGETIGIFVAAGNLRNITADDPAQSPVMERSNVVLVPMPDVSGATHSF